MLRYAALSAISTPPPMAAPLTNANVGMGNVRSCSNVVCPSCPMASACSRLVTFGTPVRSAPTAKMNGLPVRPTPTISPASARTRSVSSTVDRPARVAGPKVLGLVWSKPLSSVISTNVPAPCGRAMSRASALVMTSSGELGHQPDARAGQGVPRGDRTAVLVHPGVVVGDAEVVQESEHLDGEGLVELKEADVLDGETGLLEGLLGRGHGADAHHLGLDAHERIGGQAHPHGQPELGGSIGRGHDARGRAVGQTRAVAGGDVAMGTEGCLQPGDVTQGGPGPR